MDGDRIAGRVRGRMGRSQGRRFGVTRVGQVGVAAALMVAVVGCGSEGQGVRDEGQTGGVVNVYSHRHYEADQELFRRFTERTGIQVNVVTASADELITRLENEGPQTPADVLITVDAGRLHRAKQRELLQAVSSDVLSANVPEHLRDAEGYWFGLTQRARVLVYHRGRVQRDELSTYEALAEPQWRNRVLIRSSSNVYNQSLLASLIAHVGPAAAEQWAAGIVANMARPPSGGDTDQIKAVAAGAGDVAVVNTYYLAQLASSNDPEERRVAEQVGAFFPNQNGRGTHVNVSGAAVTRHSRNRENAIRLIEFLSEDEAQNVFAQAVQEYPVKLDIAWSETLRGWGTYKADDLPLSRLGDVNDEAVRIFDRVRWR